MTKPRKEMVGYNVFLMGNIWNMGNIWIIGYEGYNGWIYIYRDIMGYNGKTIGIYSPVIKHGNWRDSNLGYFDGDLSIVVFLLFR